MTRFVRFGRRLAVLLVVVLGVSCGASVDEPAVLAESGAAMVTVSSALNAESASLYFVQLGDRHSLGQIDARESRPTEVSLGRALEDTWLATITSSADYTALHGHLAGRESSYALVGSLLTGDVMEVPVEANCLGPNPDQPAGASVTVPDADRRSELSEHARYGSWLNLNIEEETSTPAGDIQAHIFCPSRTSEAMGIQVWSVFSASMDNTVPLYIETPAGVREIAKRDCWYNAVALDPGEQRLAVTAKCEDNNESGVYLLDLTDEASSLVLLRSGRVGTAAFSPSGERIAYSWTGPDDPDEPVIEILDIASGERARVPAENVSFPAWILNEPDAPTPRS